MYDDARKEGVPGGAKSSWDDLMKSKPRLCKDNNKGRHEQMGKGGQGRGKKKYPEEEEEDEDDEIILNSGRKKGSQVEVGEVV